MITNSINTPEEIHRLSAYEIAVETLDLGPRETRDPEQCLGCELMLHCLGHGRIVYPATDRHGFTYHIFTCMRCARIVLETQRGTRIGTNEVFQYWQQYLTKVPDCWHRSKIAHDLFYCDRCGHEH